MHLTTQADSDPRRKQCLKPILNMYYLQSLAALIQMSRTTAVTGRLDIRLMPRRVSRRTRHSPVLAAGKKPLPATECHNNDENLDERRRLEAVHGSRCAGCSQQLCMSINTHCHGRALSLGDRSAYVFELASIFSSRHASPH